MGFGSQSGQVGLGIQSGKGSAHAATCFARLRSGGLGGDRTLLIPDPEIGGNRDIGGAYLGSAAFNGTLEFYVRMRMAAMLLYGAFGTKSSSTTSATNEVQTIAETGTPTGGTFTLSFRGVTTAPIAYNAASSAVVAALVAASSAAGTGVFVSGDAVGAGGALPASVTLTFAQQYAGVNVPAITVNYSGLTGGTSPTITVTGSTPGVPPIGTHIITPADTLPWLTIEERIGNEFETFQYVDGKVNDLKFNCDANGFLMGSADLTALSQTSDVTAQVNPAWDNTPSMVGAQIQVYFNNILLPAKSFSFEVNNNIETDDFALGSVFRSDLTEKRRDVKAGCSYRPADSALWKSAMYGSSAVSIAGAGPAYSAPLRIVMTTYETIGDASTAVHFSLTLDFPKVVVAPYKINPSGDDVIQTDLEFTAIRPDSAVPIVTATVVTDLATVV